MNTAHIKQADIEKQEHQVSPVSTINSRVGDPASRTVSPVEPAAYFPDDKIAVVAEPTIHELSSGAEVVIGDSYIEPPRYSEGALPPRPSKRAFWKKNIVWILGGIALAAILIATTLAVKLSGQHAKTKTTTATLVPNNTLHSVATSGQFLKDKSWNMQVLWQNTTGEINMKISQDGGKTFAASRNIDLPIKPKVGSPLSATTEVDSETGVIQINLFYIATDLNITSATLTCASTSTKCTTLSSLSLTTNGTSPTTGLSAVNVNNAEDWRIYYHDSNGLISQLAGNASGFDTGAPIGGMGLNGSSIAACNVNATTNNINVFFVDMLTEALMVMQFTKDSWTTPIPLSSQRVQDWNPNSGISSAYTSTTDQLHVYYTGLDSNIYEFLGHNASRTTNTTWDSTPGNNHLWAQADYVGADVASVGWAGQVRFFMVGGGSAGATTGAGTGGKLVMGSLGNGTWGEGFI